MFSRIPVQAAGSSSPGQWIDPERGAASEQICGLLNALPAPIAEALSSAGIAMAYVDLREQQVRFSASAQRLLGAPEKMGLNDILARIGRRYRREVSDLLVRASQSGDPGDARSATFPFDGGSGEARWVEAILSPCPEKGSERFVAVLRDATDRCVALEQLREERDHLRHTVELNPQLPWVADAYGRVLEFTERWLALTGLTQEEALGEGWARVTHPDDLPMVQEQITKAVMTGESFDVRLRVNTKTQSFRWMQARGFPLRNAKGKIIRWYGYTEDIDDHVRVEKQIRWTADHDSLTKLPNRAVFNQRLEQALGENYVPGRKVGLMLIDVDNFKDVNDVLGHDAGDALLIAFSEMLSAALAPNVLLARIGGDEFAVLIQGDGGDFDLGPYCEAIYNSLKDSIIINGRTIDCRFSIGGAVYPLHGLSPTELFKNADIALYEAKARGKSRFTLFSVEMKQLTQRRVAMINLGREAVESGSILPYYQLQMSLENDRPVGFEALLRRRDRQGRICAPATIAAAFEDTEVAEALGDAMLSAVLTDMRRASDEGVDLGTVSINFSTAEFRSNTFVERLTTRMDKAGIPFHRLGIEVTEGVLLGRQSDKAVETIAELNHLGFKIALDDFGTGYASLLHLRQIPVDTLKIDQSFIRNLTQSKDDHAIVAAIINLGESLGLHVIAEGIETEDQLEALRRLKLKRAQGYLFSRPIPIEQARLLVSDHPRSPRLELARTA